jgi:hypothetical protein
MLGIIVNSYLDKLKMKNKKGNLEKENKLLHILQDYGREIMFLEDVMLINTTCFRKDNANLNKYDG